MVSLYKNNKKWTKKSKCAECLIPARVPLLNRQIKTWQHLREKISQLKHELFFSGTNGRKIRGEHQLLFEISLRYLTQESTMGLARELLGSDGFIRSRITSMEMVNWKMMAYKVILEWIKISGTRNSLTLLNALARTNREVAEEFWQNLTCGKNINHFAKIFILDIIMLCWYIRLPLSHIQPTLLDLRLASSHPAF